MVPKIVHSARQAQCPVAVQPRARFVQLVSTPRLTDLWYAWPVSLVTSSQTLDRRVALGVQLDSLTMELKCVVSVRQVKYNP
eukprot:SAG22_NODE_21_length_31784_cov_15.522897_24_plen_82_part_00